MSGLITALVCLASAATGVIAGFLVGFCVGREEPK